ncbi:MAG: cation:proton antiporter [Myxococcales bacterium]|nr:cation:proton antiporter [Myxococcales bacterium]
MTIELDHPALTLALAMVAGVLAQVAARHLRLPGIVVLLGLGVALGPDAADVIRPHLLGEGLSVLVGFAIAIILFEGGLNLRVPVLRAQALPIRRLVTVGALVTAVLAAVATRVVMGWDWRLSILFATLVIVTGPTVVTPLVRRLRLMPHLAAILVAEGIFIDAVGATIAVVALEVAVAPSRSDAALGGLSIFLRFGGGALVGLAGGALLVLALRVRHLVPHGLENILALAVAVTTFHVSNALIEESGITAAIVAGLVVGNVGFKRLSTVAEFKEQLTDLLVATLFVLLAADVRLADVRALGAHGLAVVALLIFVVRPACVFASTYRTDLTVREKVYLSWVAPRGIVAAAVASLFAGELAHAHLAGGTAMRALVFLVIATTVTLQGLTAGLVAERLGLRLPPRNGFVILGANPLARLVAGVLVRAGARVTLIDANSDSCAAARDQGIDVVQGDALATATQIAAGVESASYAVGLTSNEHINYLFGRRIDRELRGPELLIALERHDRGITMAVAEHDDIDVLFGAEADLLIWLDRVRRGEVVVNRLALSAVGPADASLAGWPIDAALPIARVRGAEIVLMTRRTDLRVGDHLMVAATTATAPAATAWLDSRGWRAAAAPTPATGAAT